jgi:hypothetical protein
MNYEQLFPGRFLKGVDFDNKEYTLTIKSVDKEKIKDKWKAIISFEKAEREFVCNRTNAEAIALMFGTETDAWCGKRITLHAPVLRNPFTKSKTPQIRVKGSPEITQAMSADIERGEQVIRVRVVPTGKGVANGNARRAAPPPRPSPSESYTHNPDTGEVPFGEDKIPVGVEDLPPGDPPGLPGVEDDQFVEPGSIG